MKTNILCTSLLAAVFTCHTASATLIFSDNFNTADTTNLNNDLATRQSGPAATKTYGTGGQGSKTIFSNSLSIDGLNTGGTQDSNVILNYNFATDPDLLVGGAYKVAFDLFHDSRSYAAFTMGGTSSLQLRPIIGSRTDIGILMDNTGKVEIFDNGTNVLANTSAVTGFSGFVPVEIVVTTDNFSNGTPFSFSLSINGESVSLGSAANGTWDVDGTNYMTFSNRSSDIVATGNNFSRFDNFTVTAIPEPGSLMLLGLGALAMALVCRRRTR